MAESVLYESTVTNLGEQAQDLIEDGMVVIFKEGAPSELAEISVLHEPKGAMEDAIQTGDTLSLGEDTFRVTSVGDEANKNMEELGHATLKFNGSSEAELPGDINIEDKPIPKLTKGVRIAFSRP